LGVLKLENLIKKANILIEALPYIQELSGKTVVVKYGGNAMVSEGLKNSVMEDITLLKYVGMNPIVVHGGGPSITEALNNFNVKSEFVNGLRVTDKKTMDVAQMVLVGQTNKEIVSLLNLKGGKAIGICGKDGNLIECEKYMPEINGKNTDIGYVGKITNINCKILNLLAKDEYIPIVAPIGIGSSGESYNINADTVAGAIASAMKAEKLMLITDVRGIKYSMENNDIIPILTKKETLNLIEKGVINSGMIPKVLGCIEALDAGVNKTHIIDGTISHCIILEIFTDKGIGTMITK
jgi:acetylglutamate kinase